MTHTRWWTSLTMTFALALTSAGAAAPSYANAGTVSLPAVTATHTLHQRAIHTGNSSKSSSHRQTHHRSRTHRRINPARRPSPRPRGKRRTQRTSASPVQTNRRIMEISDRVTHQHSRQICC